MKKLIELLIIVCMAVCWTGCGEDEKDPAGEQDTTGNQEPGNKEDCITFVTQKDKLDISIAFPRSGEVTIEWGDGNVTVYRGTKGSSYGKIPCYNEEIEYIYSKQVSGEHTIKIKGPLLSFFCTYNMITSLVVEGNPSLITLWCQNNKLTSLDVSDCDTLDFLACDQNKLTSLDVGRNSKLRILGIIGNPITSLDVKNNSLLEILEVSETGLSSLDISGNKRLHTLDLRSVPFDAAMMNRIYTDLPQGGKYISSGGYEMTTTIYVSDPKLGNSSIATEKGWVLKDRR